MLLDITARPAHECLLGTRVTGERDCPSMIREPFKMIPDPSENRSVAPAFIVRLRSCGGVNQESISQFPLFIVSVLVMVLNEIKGYWLTRFDT